MDLWEYGDKVRSCSSQKEHSPDCDGNCEVIELTQLKVDLHNEAEEWTKRDMPITGIPRGLRGAAPGIAVEIFELECRFAGLIKYLEDTMPGFDVEKASEAYQEIMLNKLRTIRKMVDKEARANIAVAQSQLLGPDGEVLH